MLEKTITPSLRSWLQHVTTWKSLNMELSPEKDFFFRWADRNVKVYITARPKLHASCKINIFIHLIIYYVSKLLKLQWSSNSWVQNKQGYGMGWNWAWCLQIFRLFFRFLLTAAILSIFDPKFESNLLSQYLTSRSIIQ